MGVNLLIRYCIRLFDEWTRLTSRQIYWQKCSFHTTIPCKTALCTSQPSALIATTNQPSALTANTSQPSALTANTSQPSALNANLAHAQPADTLPLNFLPYSAHCANCYPLLQVRSQIADICLQYTVHMHVMMGAFWCRSVTSCTGLPPAIYQFTQPSKSSDLSARDWAKDSKTNCLAQRPKS